MGIDPDDADVAAVLLTMCGIALFFLDQLSPGNLLGNFVAIGAGLSMAVMYIATGRADEVLSIKTAYEERFLGMGLPITYTRFSLGDRRDFPWFDWEGDDETEKDSEAERQLR